MGHPQQLALSHKVLDGLQSLIVLFLQEENMVILLCSESFSISYKMNMKAYIAYFPSTCVKGEAIDWNLNFSSTFSVACKESKISRA